MLLFRSETSILVNNLNIQLGSPLDNLLPLLGRNLVGNLGSELLVVHKKDVQLVNVVDTELQETIGQKVPGLLVGSVTDLGHGAVALESSANATVNTMGFAP